MGDQNKVKVLSPDFIHCKRDDLIILIARMLKSLIWINDKYDSDSISPANLTRFHSRTPPGISVYSYLARLSRYSSIENAVLIATVYYIDLLSAVYSSFTLNSLTVHRFLLTATTVGSKGLCDSFCSNSHYAKVGGIHSNELDILEREFLTKVNYRILPRELNIRNCSNEKNIANNQERKHSINTLEDEKALPKEISDQGLNNPIQQHELKNSGYNVLDLYYRKMVILVGKEVSSDDDDLVNHFEYVIDDKIETAEEIPNTMIKTEYDTLPDRVYYEMIGKLEHGNDLPNTDSNSNIENNSSHVRYIIPPEPASISSPLKRPIDSDSAYLPNGKKSFITK
jgi:hypothetical protein